MIKSISHPYYKNIDEQKYKKDELKYGYNINDFSGHSICDLFVCKYFDSIKEEVLNSKYINIAEWNQFVIKKANHYINTEKCKKMKCIHGKYGGGDPLHYDIPSGAPLVPA